MTEDEAKSKWCPMVRLVPDNGVLCSNRIDNRNHTLCLASDCMAWRTQKEVRDLQASQTPIGSQWRMIREYGQGGAVTHRKVWEADGGYCGLAGRP